MRLDKDDPVKEWREHVATMKRHAEFLNKHNFEYLVIKNGLGTDLKVCLAIDHEWMPAEELAQDNIPFIANMPTEEIFTAPHKTKVDGVLKNALPLAYNGNIIDGFTIEFKDGKIVNYTADKGYVTLKGLIETDDGTHYLGEVALIGKNSPIAKSGLLFYNTLFDENASCHLAIGKAYPTNILGGEKLTTTELDKLGVNDSIEHVDFMIGTKDLKIVGETCDGTLITIFDDGDWAID
jgi:aminopeptidase